MSETDPSPTPEGSWQDLKRRILAEIEQKYAEQEDAPTGHTIMEREELEAHLGKYEARAESILTKMEAESKVARAEMKSLEEKMDARHEQYLSRASELDMKMDGTVNAIKGEVGQIRTEVKALSGQIVTNRWIIGLIVAIAGILVAVLA